MVSTVNDLPVFIENSENIVRAVKTPYHIDKKGKLRGKAFHPPKGASVVSVIREIMGLEFCTQKGQEICGDSFIGLAFVQVGALRSLGDVDVTDERGDFLGHAHINYHLIADADNPDVELIPLCRKIAELARYCPNS